MITHTHGARTAQRGIVLVSSLLLLLVVTIIALSMFRSFGIQEKIAGNMREKQRALQAAVTAQQYAEWWLGNNGATSPPVACAALLNANLNQGQICSNKLPLVVTDVTQVPWLAGTAPVGVTFTPTGMQISSTTTNLTANTILNPTYFNAPTFYISDMGASADPSIPGEIYQIDAVGYGGNSNTAAVVESTYAVYTSSACRGCP
jgi:type IV pilus assembly protein PilX